MLTQIKQWLEPPQFEGDEDKTSQTRIANTLILYLGAALLVVIFILIPLFAFQKIGSWILSITMLCGLVIGRHLIFKGRFQLGGTLIFAIIYLCILSMMILSGGSSGTAMFYFATVVLIAGFFLDARVVNGFTIATFLIAMGISVLQEHGLVTIPKVFVFNSAFSWLATGIGLLFMIRTRDLFVGNLESSLALSRQENANRQKAEATLRESEARFRAVVEHSNTGIVFMSVERKIKYVSPAYQELLGFTAEEMVGRFGAEYIYPEDRELTAQKFTELLQAPAGTLFAEYRLQRKDGSYVWIETIAANLLDDPYVQAVVLSQRDINERKLAEEEVKNSEKRFHDLIEHGRDSISLLAADGTLLWESPSTYNILGYAPNQFLGHNIFELMHPDDQAWTGSMYAQVVQLAGSIQEAEFRLSHADGTWRWIECSATNLLDEPSVQAIVINYRDITARKRADEALRESEIRYRTLFEKASDGIFYLSTDGEILTVNESFARMHGYSVEEMQGMQLQDLDTPENVQRTPERMQRILAGEILEFETEHYHKEGHVFPLAVSTGLISVGGQNIIQAFHRNITERRHAEEALRESEAKYRHHFENVVDVIYTLDQEFRITSASPSVEKILGYAPSELIGKTFLELGVLAPEYLEAAITDTLKVFNGERLNAEYAFIAKNGERLFGEITGTPLRDAHGQIVGVLSIARDITDRKRAQEALLKQNQFLIALQNTTLELVSQLDLKTLLENIVKRATALVGTSAGLLDLIDPATNQLIPQVGVGVLEESLHLQVQPGEGLTGIVWQTGEMLVIPDYDQWAGRLGKFSQGTLGSVIGVPLVSGTHVLGVLVTGSAYGLLHPFEPAAIEILNQFARLATVAVQNARVFSDLQAELTERKRAEQALQESEARLRAVVHTANDAIITMDTNRAIVEWNTAAESIFGFSTEEALGMSVNRIVPEQFRAQQDRSIEHALVSKERHIVGKTVEVAGLTKDGREFPIEMSLAEWNTPTGNFFTAIIRDISERKQREKELQAIASLSAALRTAPTRAEMLPIIIDQINTLLNSDAATVEIIDPQTGDVTTEVANGVWANLAGLQQAKGTGINAIISRTLEPYITHDLENDSNTFYHEWARAGIRGSAGVPLIAQEKLIGFIWVGRKTDITESEVRLLSSVTDIAANAIQRATLHEQTQKDAEDLARAYDTTLEGWAHALELRDHETEGHTRRVVQMTINLARAMGIGESDLENIRRGALLHDIGKMGIPDSILHKEGTLNKDEWAIMRQHPEYAYKLLEPIEYLHPVLDIPYCHHEKWDGGGYPRGLKGEKIPLAARIFAIVDVWDALTSDRPYRTAWAREKALAYIAEQSNKHFDPIVVDAFLKII